MHEIQPSRELQLKDAFDLYENGKHRRYSLLFSVNGGAFAIAKLFMGQPEKADHVLGALTLRQLSFGMAVFTAIMVWDIWAFGIKMRRSYLKGAFGREGKVVLLSLGALLCLGWLLVGAG
jgi:hypothetical protein